MIWNENFACVVCSILRTLLESLGSVFLWVWHGLGTHLLSFAAIRFGGASSLAVPSAASVVSPFDGTWRSVFTRQRLKGTGGWVAPSFMPRFWAVGCFLVACRRRAVCSKLPVDEFAQLHRPRLELPEVRPSQTGSPSFLICRCLNRNPASARLRQGCTEAT